MEDDILEVVQNREFLFAVKQGHRTGENVLVLSQLSSYADCAKDENDLRENKLLTFATVFNEPLGYYLMKCFLTQDHSLDKARFVSDVQTYRMLSAKARQRLAPAIYQRFCEARLRLVPDSGHSPVSGKVHSRGGSGSSKTITSSRLLGQHRGQISMFTPEASIGDISLSVPYSMSLARVGSLPHALRSADSYASPRSVVSASQPLQALGEGASLPTALGTGTEALTMPPLSELRTATMPALTATGSFPFPTPTASIAVKSDSATAKQRSSLTPAIGLMSTTSSLISGRSATNTPVCDSSAGPPKEFEEDVVVVVAFENESLDSEESDRDLDTPITTKDTTATLGEDHIADGKGAIGSSSDSTSSMPTARSRLCERVLVTRMTDSGSSALATPKLANASTDEGLLGAAFKSASASPPPASFLMCEPKMVKVNCIGVYGESVPKLQRAILQGCFEADLFDEVLSDVLDDLCFDVFPRFLECNLFKLYIQLKHEELRYCPIGAEQSNVSHVMSAIEIGKDKHLLAVGSGEKDTTAAMHGRKARPSVDERRIAQKKEEAEESWLRILPKKGTRLRKRMSEESEEKCAAVSEISESLEDVFLKGDIELVPILGATANRRVTAKAREKVTIGDFEVLRVLGRGAFGYVNACIRKLTGVLYAMKCIDKRRVKATDSVDTIMAERNFLSMMNSRFVTGLKYAFMDKNSLYLIMDLMVGGDLKFHLNKDHFFTLERSRFYAAQVLLGIEHIHSLGIVYRDVKLENVLLDALGNCKISDLGLAVAAGANVYSYAGTPGYTAPEVCLQQSYGQMADWFSFGVLVYRFLSGKKPFELPRGARRRKDDRQRRHHAGGRRSQVNDLDKNVIEVEPMYPSDCFDPVSRCFLRGLLMKRIADRLGANGVAEIKEHCWFDSIDFGHLESANIAPPFEPNQDEINAGSLRHISRPPLDDKYASVRITESFDDTLKQFPFTSARAIQSEFVAVLRKVHGESHWAKFDEELPSGNVPPVPKRLLRKQQRALALRTLRSQKTASDELNEETHKSQGVFGLITPVSEVESCDHICAVHDLEPDTDGDANQKRICAGDCCIIL